jgi:RNA polymerase sigma-70 factor (ECF subfamily)
MVLRRCRRLLRHEEQAVDAMHDVFVALLRHQDRLEGSAPSSLLFRMATNICLNRLRSARRRPEDADYDLVVRIAQNTSDEGKAQSRGLLAQIFAREQESTGLIAVLFFVDGMTLEEVAAQVGLSVSGVRKRLRTLKARIQDLREVA